MFLINVLQVPTKRTPNSDMCAIQTQIIGVKPDNFFERCFLHSFKNVKYILYGNHQWAMLKFDDYFGAHNLTFC